MRSMLKCAGLDKSFRADALIHATYLRNHLPHATLGISPCEKITLRKPNLSHFVYWRDGERKDLLFAASPDLLPDNYEVQHPNSSPRDPDAFVDSDWGGNIANRKSISVQPFLWQVHLFSTKLICNQL